MIIFLRGIILFFTLIIVSISSSVILIKHLGWLTGIALGVILFVILAGIAIALFNKFSTDKITNFDIILPAIISLGSAACFWPLRFLRAELFSSASCIMSGVILSMAFYKLKNDMIHKASVVIIFCTFLYEISPISLPLDLDNLLSLGTSTLAYLFGKKEVEEISETNRKLIDADTK